MTGLHHTDLLALQGTEDVVVLHRAGTLPLLAAACVLPILLEDCKSPAHLEPPGTSDALWHITRLFWNCSGPKEGHLLTIDGVALQSRRKIELTPDEPSVFLITPSGKQAFSEFCTVLKGSTASRKASRLVLL